MTEEQKIIKAKVGLLELARQLGNVSQACKMLGCSRDSFYRFKELYDKGGGWRCKKSPARSRSWRTGSRRRSRHRLSHFALEQPAFGQIRVANEMRKLGFSIFARRGAGRLAAP
jgi:hypothetical protein